MGGRKYDNEQLSEFEVVKHPPYSPDLAPSDFHLFGPMKEQLRGQKFADDNEVMEALQSWLKATQKSATILCHNLVNKTNLVHNFSWYVYFFSVHVSGDYVSIIRRNNCIYATLGICHSVMMGT
jgi:hypothetical protein